MTTLIHNCGNPETAFTAQQLTWLANTYQETSHTTRWQPGEELPDMLIVSDIDRKTAESLDLAEEDLVDYYDATKLLSDASEAKMRADKPQRDIIMPAGYIPPQQRNEPMTVTDAIDLTAMLIDNDLCDDSIPEHIKSDLRVLKRLIGAIQTNYPFAREDDLTSTSRRKWLCELSLHEIVQSIVQTSKDTIDGKFHQLRKSEQEEVNS